MRKELVFACFALLFVLLISTAVVAVAHPAHPFTLVNSIWLPSMGNQNSFTLWTGGTLLTVEDRFSDSPTFRMFDRDGSPTSKFAFAIPGASLVRLYDHSVARRADGTFAIIGSDNSDDPGGASFLAFWTPDRAKQTIVRTSPFVPQVVTWAADGTVWVAGYEKKERVADPWDLSQHVLVRYDSAGNRLSAFERWTDLKKAPETGPPPSEYSILLPLPGGVGWYSPRAHDYLEFSLNGVLRHQFGSVPHDMDGVLNAASCADGSVFVATKVSRKDLQIFSLDRQHSTWSLLPKNESMGWGGLMGCDGTRLVAETEASKISWIETAGQ